MSADKGLFKIFCFKYCADEMPLSFVEKQSKRKIRRTRRDHKLKAVCRKCASLSCVAG